MAQVNYLNRSSVKILGQFKESDYGNFFEYMENTDENDFSADYPHTVAIGDSVRYAKVLTTVAYIVVDENENGEPVVEKWSIKKV